MALTEYKKKRTFRKTPEPTGGRPAGKKLRFVVQKHAASRLHYDFRLELNGVLVSWAVPKGPSLNPADKRLAMRVEDHPFDYKDFEGIIPEGNYGAGTVIIWDHGTYEPVESSKSKKDQERTLEAQLKKGSVKIRLHGKKLNGEFALVDMKGRGDDNAWLLIKHRDEFASKDDIASKDESAVSGKTLEQVAGSKRSKVWGSNPRSSGTKTRAKSSRRSLPTAPTRPALLNPEGETQVRKVDGRDLKFTNLSKVFWPEDGYTKRDMLNYYHQVAPIILPYMKDRPQTLNRFPHGIHGQSFYQKDVTGKVPTWIKKYRYFSEGDKREKHFLVCTDEASLLYMASLGCIEMNPWSSRVDKPDHPDWCVVDLDPGKKTTFDQVIEAARMTKDVLDTLELPAYCKTSGSTGLHIYIPLGARYSYEESKEFARALVKIVHAQLPSVTTLERTVSHRKGRMYLDFLQNRPQATLAGPYSLRPKTGAPVSTPLHWDEVKKGLRTLDFSIKNVIARFRETGDLFAGVLGKGINLPAAIEALNKVSM